MKYTGNYNLKKPEGTDVVDIADLNDNMDVLDAEVHKKANKTYVDNKVKTDVPANAKFTDTIVDVSGKADKSEVQAVNSQLGTHKLDKANPHSVTKGQVGLANVINVKQASKAEHDTLASQVSGLNTDLDTHKAEKATLTKLGHVKADTTPDGLLIPAKLTIEKFETPGTFNWTVPEGVTVVYISGAGGGGGLTNPGGGSGGGGAFGIDIKLDVTPGEMFLLTVGAGGEAQSGGMTSFGNRLSFSGGGAGHPGLGGKGMGEVRDGGVGGLYRSNFSGSGGGSYGFGAPASAGNHTNTKASYGGGANNIVDSGDGLLIIKYIK